MRNFTTVRTTSCLLFLTCLGLFLGSCQPDEPVPPPVVEDPEPEPPYSWKTDPRKLIVGVTSHFCFGDCTTLFLIQDGNVYPDDSIRMALRYTSDWKFLTEPLADVDSLQMDSLYRSIPAVLDGFPYYAFGCPGCEDEPAFPFCIANGEGGPWKSYNFDIDTSTMRQQFRPFGALLQRVVLDLSP